MMDCGLNAARGWYPSVAYGGQRIDTLMLMNLDEDHCEDLPYLWGACPIGAIVSNPTVNGWALRQIKAQNGMRQGVAKALEIFEGHGAGMIGDWQNDLGGVGWHVFWNRYGSDFWDTNNLSMAAFVRFGSFTMLYGGDMERAGWRRLLTNRTFRLCLAETKVYLASHHGRENGCCDELFDLFRPELVIVSDDTKAHGTQETNGWYARRAIGIPDLQQPSSLAGRPLRKVMTTRRDGSISINVGDDGRYLVTASRTQHKPLGLAMLAGLQPSNLPTGFGAYPFGR